jgi:hypothetical protein
MDSEESGHEEDSRVTPIAHFDLDLVCRNLFEPMPEAEMAALSQTEIDAALKLCRTIWLWVFQDGMKNQQGLQIRSAIACWVFLKELRSITMTELATGFGMDKQSIERWVADFKERFPRIRIPHMRPS